MSHTYTACLTASLQEVDREQLSGTVLKLISSVASTAPTDDKSREAVIWHPAAVAVTTTNLNDPLGFGRIDLVNLRLVGTNAGCGTSLVTCTKMMDSDGLMGVLSACRREGQGDTAALG